MTQQHLDNLQGLHSLSISNDDIFKLKFYICQKGEQDMLEYIIDILHNFSNKI